MGREERKGQRGREGGREGEREGGDRRQLYEGGD